MTDRLQRSFDSLKEATARQVAGVDLRDRVLEAIDSEAETAAADADAAATAAGGWRRWALVPALVAAALIAWALWPSRGATVAVISAGERVEVAVPARLVAGADSGSTIETAAAEIRLWPGSALRVEAADRFSELAGGASFRAGRDVELALGDITLTARGAFELETHRPGAPMTLTRNHKIAGSVIVAAVVTAGWIKIRTGRGSEQIDGPGAAVVDERGEVTRLAPADWKRRGASGRTASDGDGDGAGANPVSGAYWDDDEQRIIFALAGEVFDGASGEPITAFDIEARPIESKGFGEVGVVDRSVSGSERGAFELNNLGLGTWRVTVRAADYAPSSQVVDLGDLHANPLLQFPLTEGARITGEVVDWRGEPVEGAAVGQPECHGVDDKPGCVLVKTDGDGRFTLPALPEDQVFALRAEHPRYGFSESKNLVQKPGETRHVVIPLSGVVQIHGRVSRGESAAPVAGATVASEDGQVTATTDSAGHYAMLVPLTERPQVFVVADPARPGPVKIASYPDNRSTREIRWVSEDTHVGEVEVDFRLQMESATIHGRLTDARGAPIAGATLKFSNTAGWKNRGHETFPTQAITGADGRYRLRDVPARAGYTVFFQAEGHPLTRLGFVTVPDEIDVEADFSLGSGTIRGAFETAEGERFVPGHHGCGRLGARSVDHIHHVGRCLGDGRFEFTGLPPGTYTLENRQPLQSSSIEITPTRGVEVAAGAVVADVVVVVSGQEAQIWKLRILDASGRFIPGAYFRYRDGMTSFTSNLQVGDDGVASISLGKQQMWVNIDAPGYKSVKVELTGRDPEAVISVRMQRDSS